MESYNMHSDSDREYLGRRKGRKLMAEKRRRTRINQCLNEIKDIVCASQKQNDPNYDKLEKAEILETTVDYLRKVKKFDTSPERVKQTLQARFQEGYSQCAQEILSSVLSLPDLSYSAQHQIKKYLSNRVHELRQVPVTPPAPVMTSLSPVMTSQSPILVTPTPMPTSNWSYQSCTPVGHSSPMPYAHAPAPVYPSPIKENDDFSDSGYLSSPHPNKYTQDNKSTLTVLSDSELYSGSRRNSGKFDDCKVKAWLESTWSFSQQIKAEQQAPWRPW